MSFFSKIRRNDGEGFTLIELMVGLTVFMLGMIGLAGMLITQARGNRISKGLDDAATLAQSKLEDMSAITFSVLGTDVSSPSNNGLTSANILSEGPLNGLGTSNCTGTGLCSYYRYTVVCTASTPSVSAGNPEVYCGNVTGGRPSVIACSSLTPALTTAGREKMVRVMVSWTDKDGKCHYKNMDSLQFN